MFEPQEIDVNVRLIDGCSMCDTRMMKQWIDKGADVNYKSGYPLKMCIDKNFKEGVKLLFDEGCDININSGMALRLSAEENRIEMTNFLLSLGSEIPKDDDIDPIIWSFLRGNLEICETLIRNGSNIYLKDYYLYKLAIGIESDKELIMLLNHTDINENIPYGMLIVEAQKKWDIEKILILLNFIKDNNYEKSEEIVLQCFDWCISRTMDENALKELIKVISEFKIKNKKLVSVFCRKSIYTPTKDLFSFIKFDKKDDNLLKIAIESKNICCTKSFLIDRFKLPKEIKILDLIKCFENHVSDFSTIVLNYFYSISGELFLEYYFNDLTYREIIDISIYLGDKYECLSNYNSALSIIKNICEFYKEKNKREISE